MRTFDALQREFVELSAQYFVRGQGVIESTRECTKTYMTKVDDNYNDVIRAKYKAEGFGVI